MSDEEIKEARSAFKTALLFDKYSLTSGPGTFAENPDGLFKDNYIEAAWRGFLMCWERENNLLDRCDPMRYISPGMVTQFKNISGFEYEDDPEQELVIHDAIRASLTVCRGTPV